MLCGALRKHLLPNHHVIVCPERNARRQEAPVGQSTKTTDSAI
jgi:hypothetical protein